MLAGQMKLKTFKAIVGVGGGVVLLGGVVLYATMCRPEPEPYEPPPVATRPAPPTPEVQPAVTPVTTNPADPARPWDNAILAFQDKDLGGPKKKDLAPGEPWKVNLYQDEGHATLNRAKVDLDRDEQWDEKWTLEGGVVSRQVSPGDDGVYTETWIRQGMGWVPEGQAPAAEEQVDADPQQPATDPARPWDAVLMGWQGKDLGTPKIKDASKGTSWKINLYQDEGNTSINRAKVDIDRDDKWDEKWTFKADGLSRKLSSADDETYDQTWGWSGEAWVQE